MKFKSKLQANGLANIPSVVVRELGIVKGDYIEFDIITKNGKTIVTVKRAKNDEHS